MLNGLDVFSGIGGISIALQQYIRPIAYIEIDPYCRGVLLSRMSTGNLRIAPIWDDICTFDGTRFKDHIDVIYGGFPCQDISIAGIGKGLEGKRSGLVKEIYRLARELCPPFIFLENVPAITSRGGVALAQSLAEIRYDARWGCISASQMGYPHKRERWFLLAYSQSQRFQKERFSMREEKKFAFSYMQTEHGFRDKEPEDKLEVARMADGISNRAHRIKALGNAVVPEQAKKAFEILMGLANERN